MVHKLVLVLAMIYVSLAGLVSLATVSRADGPPIGYEVPMIFTLVGGQTILDQIATWPDGYIMNRDTIMISKPQFTAAQHLTEVNQLADNIRAEYPNVTIGVRTFGQKYMRNLKNAALSPNITVLSYVYEPRWEYGDEPEFSTDFTKTLANYAKLESEMAAWTNQGKQIWTEPTGQGLPHRTYQGWNYAQIAQYVDVVSIQSQRNAQEQWNGTDPNSYTDAIAQVTTDMQQAGVAVWYMQLSIGNEVNGIPGNAAFNKVFVPWQVPSQTPGLNLWVNYQSVSTEGYYFMSNWAGYR